METPDTEINISMAAAQTAITSVGTLTALAVDNITIDGNTISSTAGTDLNITPLSGQQIVLDGAIVIDAGVVTGATSITSTAFVGTLSTAAQTNITSLGALTSLDITSAALGTECLTIKAHASQSGHMINVTDSSDTSIFKVDKDGDVAFGESGSTVNVTTNSGTTHFNLRHTSANKNFNIDYPGDGGELKFRSYDGGATTRVAYDENGNAEHTPGASDAPGIHLVAGAYVNRPVPATGTTTEDATVTLDLSLGNYFNVLLGADVTAVEFTKATIGQRFIVRFVQVATATDGYSISWSTVRINGSTAAELKWAGNITPTMTGIDSQSYRGHKDVYGFLCTATGGSANDTKFDGFIIGQDLPD